LSRKTVYPVRRGFGILCSLVCCGENVHGPESEGDSFSFWFPRSPSLLWHSHARRRRWLGISYNDPRVDRVAAIILGSGGGLTGDEAGILLTLDSNNYWAGVSYTFIIIFLASASILVLLNKYSRTVLKEFKGILWQSKWLLSGRFYCRDVDGLLDRHGRPYGDGCCEPAYDSCMGNHTSILDSKIRGRLRREEIESSPMVTS